MLGRVLQAVAILLAGVATAFAQTPYPSHTITMVVAFNAGGSTDLIARVLAQHMGSILGQTIIIENKGGADGAIGTAGVTRAEPDGYTHDPEHHQHACHQSLALQEHRLQSENGLPAGLAGGAVAEHPGVEPEI